MKKTAPKPYPMNSQMGAIDRLGSMVNRRSTRKGIPPKTNAISNKHDQEALIDQIDKQVGQLLLRSSDIESKLDAIEGIKRPKYTRTETKTNKTKKTKMQETHVQRQTVQIQPQDQNLQALFELVQNLANEIHEMHQEQTEMRQQIRQLQEILVTEEEEENVE